MIWIMWYMLLVFTVYVLIARSTGAYRAQKPITWVIISLLWLPIAVFAILYFAYDSIKREGQ